MGNDEHLSSAVGFVEETTLGGDGFRTCGSHQHISNRALKDGHLLIIGVGGFAVQFGNGFDTSGSCCLGQWLIRFILERE